MPTTILAIDDSPTLRKFISKHLSGTPEQFEVLTAANGEDGVHMALEKQPRLILLDFILPDFNGDKVCEKLAESELTRSIPIILMSSSAPDIEKTEVAYEAIVQSIVKPFSPQLLLETVQRVLDNTPVPATRAEPPLDAPEPLPAIADDAPPPAAEPPAVIPEPSRPAVPEAAPASSPAPDTATVTVQGNLAHFPPLVVLRALDAGLATGRLEIDTDAAPLEVYLRDGLPCLVTSRDPAAYLSGGEFEIDEDSRDYFEKLMEKQREEGRPLFHCMAEEGLIPDDQAAELVRQYGDYYFATLWTRGGRPFRFYPLDTLPAFCPTDPLASSIDDWALRTLRCIPLATEAIGDTVRPGDTPQLNPRGYSTVASLSLDEQEVNLIREIAERPGSVEALAAQLGVDTGELRPVVYRLMIMDIVGLWSTGP